jgi:hypothetical protein
MPPRPDPVSRLVAGRRWVIIGGLVSLTLRRSLATCAALGAFGLLASAATAAAIPDATWVALAPLPNQPRTAMFAIAVDPSNSQAVVAGDSTGRLFKSTTGGAAWSPVYAGKNAVTTLSFSPFSSRLVLAGTRGGGALVSRDGGSTWAKAGGLEGRAVRAFAFALSMIVAGTDRGVYVSGDGTRWTASGLPSQSVSAVAVEAIHDPVRIVAGTDAVAPGATTPLYESVDGGATWKTLAPAIAGTMVVELVAGPLPPAGDVRPLLVGTNSGLFLSKDNGSRFTPLSGGGLLPVTDYTEAAFIGQHFDRFYVASDGGGSASGGLWRTNASGATFISLQPPEASITALATSSDDRPTLYVATFRPSTHAAALWAYHDTGAAPHGPNLATTPAASAARTATAAAGSTLVDLVGSPQLPFVGLGVAALAILLAAAVAHLRARRR